MGIRRLLIMALILAAAALWYFYPATEQSMAPLQKASTVLRSLFSSSSGLERKGKQSPLPALGIRIYKWQDADGNWQFSNQPPADGVASSSQVYRTDANVTQAVKPEASSAESASPPAETASMISPLTPLTDPQRVKQLIDDAKNVQQLIDQRQQTLEQRSQGR